MAGRKNSIAREISLPREAVPQGKLEQLARAAECSGNPLHKFSPGDFDLTPKAQARKPSNEQQSRSLCDTAKVFEREDAVRYLREGLRRGMISVARINGWPKQVWAVTDDGDPLEAQRERDGIYHGYSMPKEDPMADIVKRRWKA